MAVEVMGWALRMTGVSSTEKLVLIGLADHANRDGTAAWPSVATLAGYADVTERTVQRALRGLESAGVIVKGDQRHVQHLRADKRPTVYNLSLAAASGVTPDVERGDADDTPDSSGVTPVTERGDTSVASGVTPVSPKPSLEPSVNQLLDGTADAEPVEEGPSFHAWWDAYRDIARGRPSGYGNRQPAERAWSRLGPADRQAAVAALPAYRQLLLLEDADRRSPYPAQHGATWLNQRTFDDVDQQLADRSADTATAPASDPRDAGAAAVTLARNLAGLPWDDVESTLLEQGHTTDDIVAARQAWDLEQPGDAA